VKNIKELDKLGMVHSIWTFRTPFIGSVCNCDITYCLGMRMTQGLKIPLMFKAEKEAFIDTEKCFGCRACEDSCQFNAIEYHENDKKCNVNYDNCYGCGICRSKCENQAITLLDRTSHPV